MMLIPGFYHQPAMALSTPKIKATNRRQVFRILQLYFCSAKQSYIASNSSSTATPGEIKSTVDAILYHGGVERSDDGSN
jgi:hypothetical protein